MLGIRDIEVRTFGEYYMRQLVEECLFNFKEYIEFLRVFEQVYKKIRVVFWKE